MARRNGVTVAARLGWCYLLVVALALGAMGQPPPSPRNEDDTPPPNPGNGDDPWGGGDGNDPPPPPVTIIGPSMTGILGRRSSPTPTASPTALTTTSQTVSLHVKTTSVKNASPSARISALSPAPSLAATARQHAVRLQFTVAPPLHLHRRRRRHLLLPRQEGSGLLPRLSDADLHINAHFIGNHNPANDRTFTWIQALGITFGDHRLYVGARKAVEWDDDEDHIEITLDGEPVNVDTANNARWVSKVLPDLSVKRIDNVNSIKVDLAGVFSISASAVPISDEDSKIHSYGKTMKDSLVHLDLRFKFHSLTNNVDGVLGQTYRMDYVNKMNVTAKMPIMGGAPKYLSSGLFSVDCAVSKFHRNVGNTHVLASAS
ncbi:hypothetical protein ACQ4PT_023250 [Festuca glaucescens]